MKPILGFVSSIFAAALLVGQAPISNVDGRIEREQPVRRLTFDSQYYDYWPAVSQDGSQVIFSRNDAQLAGKWKIWKASIDTGEARPLNAADFPYDCTRPSWSHDGRWIAFRASQGGKGSDFGGGTGGLWLMAPNGENVKALTDSKKYDDYYPEWSPDNEWLAVTRSVLGDENNDIWTVSLKGGERRITTSPKYDGKSTVSSNGKEIAFASNRDGKLNIWIVDVAGGETTARQFTHDQGRAPAWSPNGKWIAFESNRSGHYAIYLKRIDGGLAIQVTDDKSVAQHPVWTSDGKSVIFDAHSKDVKGYIALVDVREIVR
jgi:Tol biopolymer transport system component